MTTPAHDLPESDAKTSILTTANELLAARMEAIAPLAEIIATRKSLQAQLDALEVPYGHAYAHAQAIGWTSEELRKMSAEEPTRRPPGRPKGKRTNPGAKKVPATPGPRAADSAESERTISTP